MAIYAVNNSIRTIADAYNAGELIRPDIDMVVWVVDHSTGTIKQRTIVGINTTRMCGKNHTRVTYERVGRPTVWGFDTYDYLGDLGVQGFKYDGRPCAIYLHEAAAIAALPKIKAYWAGHCDWK